MIIQVLCFVLRVFEAIQALFSVFLCAVFMLPDILCLKKLLHHPLCLARHVKSAAYIHLTVRDILMPSHVVFAAFTCME